MSPGGHQRGADVVPGIVVLDVIFCPNPQQVLTIPGGSALAAESMDCTTPFKVDKADTSSVEAPTA
jgi:hypothetical protein